MSHHLRYLTDIKYAMVLNMPRYSYNNIIIIATNVIILAIYSARFVHHRVQQLFYPFFKRELEHQKNGN